MVLEGIHLVPGMLVAHRDDDSSCTASSPISDEDVHRSNFWVRDSATEGLRPLEKYLDGLPEIRLIQDSLVERAHAARRARDREHVARRRDRADHGPRILGRRATGSHMSCLCTRYAKATEWAALAGARWLGRGDEEAAEEAAATGMMSALAELPISGGVVSGARSGEALLPGDEVGAGGEAVDLALDPLEGGRRRPRRDGSNGDARGRPADSMRRLPDMYMRSMAVGPRARAAIDLHRSATENLHAVATAFERNVGDITSLVLDRARHHDLIEEIRDAGGRIKLIQDGTVTASISAAIRGTNDHLAIGIGGTRQALLTAAALRCLGGEHAGPAVADDALADRGGAGRTGVDDVDAHLRRSRTSPPAT